MIGIAPPGVFAGPLLMWAILVFLVAYIAGRLTKSRATGLAIWIAGLLLPLFWIFLPFALACIASLASGVAYWRFRTKWHPYGA